MFTHPQTPHEPGYYKNRLEASRFCFYDDNPESFTFDIEAIILAVHIQYE